MKKNVLANILINFLLAIFFTTTMAATVSVPTVTEATYGEVTKSVLNTCAIATKGNFTSVFSKKVNDNCSNTSNCIIQINSQDYVPDPVFGCYKSFGAKFTCSGQTGTRGVSIGGYVGEASGHNIKLSCDQGASGITVLEATYGENAYQAGTTSCHISPKGNATNETSQACNGQANCNYPILYTNFDFGLDPSPYCYKTFKVRYTCSSTPGNEYTATAGSSTAESSGQTVNLNCNRGQTVTITPKTSGTTSELSDVVYASNTYVAVGRDGKAYVSSDGNTWDARQMGVSTGQTVASLDSVAYNSNGFAALGRVNQIISGRNTTKPYLFTSSSASVNDWVSEKVSDTNLQYPGIVDFNGSLLAVAQTITSSNTAKKTGTSWQFGNISYTSQTPYPQRVRCKNSTECIAVTSYGGIFKTTDGINWTNVVAPSASANSFFDVTWSSVAGKYIAVGNSVIKTSTDGTNWAIIPNTNQSLSGVACSDNANSNVCVAIGIGGLTYSIDNGSTWTIPTGPIDVSSNFLRITWGNNAFYVVGKNGGIYEVTLSPTP